MAAFTLLLIMTELTLCSFSVTGIKREIDQCYVKKLLKEESIDILLLQEIWLLETQLNILNDVSEDYMYTAVSGVDSKSNLLPGRPKGGVAIMWRKNILHKIKPVFQKNKRVCAIEISLRDAKQILVICCYMPCDNNHRTQVDDEFIDCLDAVHTCMASKPYHAVIIGGDINIDLNRNSANCNYLKQFADMLQLKFLWEHDNASPSATYESYDGRSTSVIDHLWQAVMCGIM